MGHELVGLLGGGVEGHGVVYAVVGGEGDFFVATVDGARRCVDQVLNGVVAAGLKDVVEADEIGLDISIGIGDVEDRGDRSASRGGMRMQVELLKVA